MTPGIVPPYLLARIATAAEPRFARAAAAAARTLAIPRPPPRVRSRLRLSIEESGTLVVQPSPAPARVVSDAQNREQPPGVRVVCEEDHATADAASGPALAGLGAPFAFYWDAFPPHELR